jgi:predicted transcriptional regulator
MSVAREYVKALIDRLTDEQVEALQVIVESMAWPTEKVMPEEAAEIEEAFADIDAGRGVKAEDVWNELGI